MILAAGVRVLRAHVHAAADLLWPPVCPRCGARALEPRTWFCEGCWSRLRTIDDAEVPGLAAAFAVDALFLDVLASGKYRRARAVLERLAHAGAAQIAHVLPEGVLVPVPLRPSRQRERGYNQSEIFATALAWAAGREVSLGRLARRRGGRPLAGRPRAERAEAVAGAFVATRRDPRTDPPPAILVDDVYTTGSTLGDCARALHEAGERVRGFAVLGRAFSSRDDVPSIASADSMESLARFA